MTVTLRPGRDEDAQPLAAILRAWIDETDWFPSPHPPNSDQFFVLRKIRDGHVTVAEAPDGTPVGFLALEDGYVSCLYVATDWRGQGVGPGLLGVAKSAAPRLRLWTFQANSGARSFYEREGFRVLQLTDGSENEEGLPDVEFEWTAEATP